MRRLKTSWNMLHGNVQRLKLLAFAIAVLSIPAAAAQSGVSPVFETKIGVNQVSIIKNFTLTLKHPARIKSVSGFDPEVIKVEPVQGSGNQVTLFALEPNVTSVTLIDEFDQVADVEVTVEGDVRHLQYTLRREFPHDVVKVQEVKGAVLLTGWVTRPENISRIIEISEKFYPDVINHMRIGGVQQVQLKAEIMEVNRTKLRELGMNFGLQQAGNYLLSTPGAITPITAVGQTSPFRATFSSVNNANVHFGFLRQDSLFQGFITALRTEGLLKIHATPVVTTQNGHPASLLNGGEAPVLVPAGLGTTAIEFKPFGIILNAVPNILGHNRLSLQVEPSVVERDFANSVTVDGIVVPSFTTRKVSTQVEMNFGETLVIGGLVSRRSDGSTSKIPFFGELPWVGAAFSRKEYTEVEIELIILVTPTPGAPLRPEQIPAGGPGQFTDVPTDTELDFMGLLEVPRIGSDCDSVFNCTGCQANGGRCSLHPFGCGLGAASGNRSGQGGDCAEGCGTTTGPMLISPGASQGTATQQLPPTVSPPTMQQQRLPLVPGSAKSETTGTTQPVSFGQPQKAGQPRNVKSPGLISPLMR